MIDVQTFLNEIWNIVQSDVIPNDGFSFREKNKCTPKTKDKNLNILKDAMGDIIRVVNGKIF